MSALLLLAALTISAEPTPEERAVAFLAREVPKWPVENKCYSCHNNGDGARALYAAKKLGLRFETDALKSTTAWLAKPDGWEDNGGKEFSDKKLAAIQFASALLATIEAGEELAWREALPSAARLVAAEQSAAGAWRIDAEGVLGSPVTYGPVLATVTALRVLRRADRKQFADQIDKGEAWLLTKKPKSVPDAAAALLGLVEMDRQEHPQAAACLEVLAQAQEKSGGFGPYAKTAPEPFDTALALLALHQFRERSGIAEQISRGRKYLVEAQLKDGSWIESTRPPGAESYAQRLSTTGWATLALLATRDEPRRP